jgi:transcriptional antiterminator RfaH
MCERRMKMSIIDRGFSWFLAQLKPNCGPIAERNLRRQGFQTFLPQEDGTRHSRGKFVAIKRPLFPGYLFVSFSASGGHWRTVNATSGVTRLVSFGGDPAPVPEAIVSSLMRRCDASGTLLPPTILKPGDQVKLTSGPLADSLATIQSITPDRRVWVLLEIMGGLTRVGVAANLLRHA